MSVCIEIASLQTSHSVVIEDNGRVAYAYLLQGNEIVGDVWLYNCTEAPDEPLWNDPNKAPYANPAGFAKARLISPAESGSDFEVKWSIVYGKLRYADIHLRDKLLARLAPGSKPGWCVLALKDGPLAKVLRPQD